MKKIISITLLTLTLLSMTVVLTACARDAMDAVETTASDIASGIGSGVDSMMGDNTDRYPTNETSAPTAPGVTEKSTDNPTDGGFGEPNVDDYDDNDKDVVGDEHESDNVLENATEGDS